MNGKAIIKAAQTSFVKMSKGTLHFTKKNSNWILAWLAILGVTGLSWAMIRGTIKAVKLCEEKKVQGTKEIIKTVWRLYIPAFGFFVLTTISIVSNAKINASKLALMTGLYAMKEADLKDFKNKVKEMVGPKKEEAIEAEVEKEKVRRLPPPSEEDIAKTGHGNTLFIDWLTGQYFRASPDYIDLVQELINKQLHNEMDPSLMRGFMHELLHLRKCGADDLVWDLVDMQEHGYYDIQLDCTHTEWMEINGQREIVCTLKCTPEASGF